MKLSRFNPNCNRVREKNRSPNLYADTDVTQDCSCDTGCDSERLKGQLTINTKF